MLIIINYSAIAVIVIDHEPLWTIGIHQGIAVIEGLFLSIAVGVNLQKLTAKYDSFWMQEYPSYEMPSRSVRCFVNSDWFVLIPSIQPSGRTLRIFGIILTTMPWQSCQSWSSLLFTSLNHYWPWKSICSNQIYSWLTTNQPVCSTNKPRYWTMTNRWTIFNYINQDYHSHQPQINIEHHLQINNDEWTTNQSSINHWLINSHISHQLNHQPSIHNHQHPPFGTHHGWFTHQGGTHQPTGQRLVVTVRSRSVPSAAPQTRRSELQQMAMHSTGACQGSFFREKTTMIHRSAPVCPPSSTYVLPISTYVLPDDLIKKVQFHLVQEVRCWVVTEFFSEVESSWSLGEGLMCGRVVVDDELVVDSWLMIGGDIRG